MCAQPYWRCNFISLLQPSGYDGIGVPFSDTPTYPDSEDLHYDYYPSEGHVFAHLVATPEDGVIRNSDNYIVGGYCYGSSDAYEVWESHHGYVICSVKPKQLRTIYIGGEYGIWHLKAIAVEFKFHQEGSEPVSEVITSKSLGISYDEYWWIKSRGLWMGIQPLDEWLTGFEGIWSTVVSKGTTNGPGYYPVNFNVGTKSSISLLDAFIVKPTCTYKAQEGEWDWIEEASFLGWPWSHRVNRWYADAYVDAVSSLPEVSANMIQNVIELATSIVKVMKGDLSGVTPGNLREAWLAYRYSFTTSKLDINDVRNATSRILALCDIPRITTHGMVYHDKYRIRCSVELDADEVIPSSTQGFMKAFGFRLSYANTWDMIPWSFVVDWFLHVGDVLERLETIQQSYNYHPVSCFCSIERLDGQFYLRTPFSYSGGASVFQNHDVRGKTIIMRIADAICLFSR